MESNFQRRWLYSCFAAAVLAGLAGGPSVTVTAVFIVIYLTGVVLIGPDADDDVIRVSTRPVDVRGPADSDTADYDLEESSVAPDDD